MTLDVRTMATNTTEFPEFPNPTYKAFMELVEKLNLSNTAGNEIINFFNKHSMCPDKPLPANTRLGREFVDSLDVPHILYRKTSIMRYKGHVYYLHYRPIFDAIKELLQKEDIQKHCVFNYAPAYNENNERIFGEQYNCKWWERVQNTLPDSACILSIILYSDATTLDQLGKSSQHPVFLTLGNIPVLQRNKPNAKVLLAYLPILKSIEKKSLEFASAKRYLFQESYYRLTKDILKLQDKGFNLHLDRGLTWIMPFISQFIGDMPESAALCLTFNSARSSYPCHQCLIGYNDLNKLLPIDDIVIRTPENMKDAIVQGIAKDYSLHITKNIFWIYK